MVVKMVVVVEVVVVVSPFHFSLQFICFFSLFVRAQAGSEKFVSQHSCQVLLSSIWYGEIDREKMDRIGHRLTRVSKVSCSFDINIRYESLECANKCLHSLYYYRLFWAVFCSS